MFKPFKWITIAVLVALSVGTLLSAACGSAPTVTPAPQATATPVPEPASGSVTITPGEAYNPIRTQHTLVAQVKGANGSAVSGASVEWILNRAPGAVGDIVSLDGSGPKK